MSDRLLTPEEYQKAIANAEPCEETIFGLTAQRDLTTAAVNAEWVEWAGSKFPHDPPDAIARECPVCWQERKRSVGL
jgi:hypothetical protein